MSESTEVIDSIPIEQPASDSIGATETNTETPTTTTTTTTSTTPPSSSTENNGEPNSENVAIANATEGGRELSKTVLYIGGIHKSVAEDSIKEVFSANSPIVSLKLLNDKNRQNYHYAFIEYENSLDASNALNNLDGSNIFGDHSILKINWAYQSQQLKAVDAFNLFIGDLSSDITDDELLNHFKDYSSLIQAHVMWDMKTGRSRGYGFLSFGDAKDAEDCLNNNNGDVLSGRSIRLNWAAHKLNNGNINNQNNNGNGNNNGNRQRNNLSNSNNHHMNSNLGINHQLNNSLGNQYMMNPTGLNVLTPPNLNINMNNNGFGINNPMNSNTNGNGMMSNGKNNTNGLVNNSIPPTGLNLPNMMNISQSQDLNQVGNGNGEQDSNTENQQQQQQGPPPQQQQLLQPRLSYDVVLRQSPSWQTTVYIGNLSHFTTQNQLIPILQNFGYIVDFKFQVEKGCAFVKYDSHERAAIAITQLIGFKLNGRMLKFGWGKDTRGIHHHQHNNQMNTNNQQSMNQNNNQPNNNNNNQSMNQSNNQSNNGLNNVANQSNNPMINMVGPPHHQLNSYARFPPMYQNQTKFN